MDFAAVSTRSFGVLSDVGIFAGAVRGLRSVKEQ